MSEGHWKGDGENNRHQSTSSNGQPCRTAIDWSTILGRRLRRGTGPDALSARESRGELAIEGPGARKDARGGSRGTSRETSRGTSKGALSTTGKGGGREGGGVAYSVLAVETGRSSAIAGGGEGGRLGKKGQGTQGCHSAPSKRGAFTRRQRAHTRNGTTLELAGD